jgi:hypothetical protein
VTPGRNLTICDQQIIRKSGVVVQLVRTLPCHGRGRGFESRRPRHVFKHLRVLWKNVVHKKVHNKLE